MTPCSYLGPMVMTTNKTFNGDVRYKNNFGEEIFASRDRDEAFINYFSCVFYVGFNSKGEDFSKIN